MSVANPSHEIRVNRAPLSPDLALLVFVKAPRPGACKTRLAAGLGARRAAAVYAAMASHVIAHAAAAAPGRTHLVCAPKPSHPFFKRMAQRHDVRLARQSRGDLGQRMRHAIDRALAQHARVVLMGSDQPMLDSSPLAHADASLDADHPAWLAPTRDGGYWAIGLTRSLSLFQGPRWSMSRVMTHTRTILRRHGIAWREYSHRDDIDNVRDWGRLNHRARSQLSRQATCPALRARPARPDQI